MPIWIHCLFKMCIIIINFNKIHTSLSRPCLYWCTSNEPGVVTVRQHVLQVQSLFVHQYNQYGICKQSTQHATVMQLMSSTNVRFVPPIIAHVVLTRSSWDGPRSPGQKVVLDWSFGSSVAAAPSATDSTSAC